MSEQVTHEWRIEIGKTGYDCHVFCDGVELRNVVSADLHLTAGEHSTLHLQLAWSVVPQTACDDEPEFCEGDHVVAVGTPKIIYLEMDGRRFKLVNVTLERDLDDGFFGPDARDGGPTR